MDFDAIQAFVRSQVGQPTGASGLPDPYLESIINIAQKEICRYTLALCAEDAGEALTTDVAEYSLSSNWFKTRFVRYSDGGGVYRKLTSISLEEYYSKENIYSGYTCKYAINTATKKIVFYPTPSSSTHTYTHFYVVIPTDLSSGSDIPFNGDARLAAYHMMVADLAIKLYMGKKDKIPSDDIVNSFIPRMDVMKRELSPVTGRSYTVERRGRTANRNRPRFPSGY
jgi:hypothetical protein